MNYYFQTKVHHGLSVFDEFIMGLAINLVLECIPAYTNACVMARLELTELKNRLIV